MLQTLMLPVDQVMCSQASIERAVRWSKRFKATLVSAGIVDETMVGAEAVPVGGEAFKEKRDAKLRVQAEEKVHGLVKRIENRCREEGIECRSSIQHGTPHERILVEAQRYDAVVLAGNMKRSTGLGEAEQTILHKVIPVTPRPIVIVPGNAMEGHGILVAYNGSNQAARALQALAGTGFAALGSIEVLSVHYDSERAARERAARAGDYLRWHGLPVTERPLVDARSADKAILEQVLRRKPELLVMGAYGRSRWSEFFLGSLTDRVLAGTTIPVFLFH